ELFVPLSLAVGYAMIASYLLSSTFVPVLSTWLLKPGAAQVEKEARAGVFAKLLNGYEAAVARVTALRWVVVPLYFASAIALAALLYLALGTAIFPPTDKGQFMLRLKAPTGTRIEWTEDLAQEAARLIKEELGPGNVEATVGYVGTLPSSYPVQGMYLWTSG